MKKIVKMSFEGQNLSKLANERNFYDLQNMLTPGVILTLPRVTYVYIIILVKQVYWYISQVAGERLQDHWSSGFLGDDLFSSLVAFCLVLDSDCGYAVVLKKAPTDQSSF